MGTSWTKKQFVHLHPEPENTEKRVFEMNGLSHEHTFPKPEITWTKTKREKKKAMTNYISKYSTVHCRRGTEGVEEGILRNRKAGQHSVKSIGHSVQ